VLAGDATSARRRSSPVGDKPLAAASIVDETLVPMLVEYFDGIRAVGSTIDMGSLEEDWGR